MSPCQLLHTLFFGCCSQLEFAPGHMACVSSSPPTHCSLWYKSSTFSALYCLVPWGGQFTGMVTIPPISYALSSCDFVPLLTERWSPLALYLNLARPCDLLWPAECISILCDFMGQALRALKLSFLSLLEPWGHHAWKKFSVTKERIKVHEEENRGTLADCQHQFPEVLEKVLIWISSCDPSQDQQKSHPDGQSREFWKINK